MTPSERMRQRNRVAQWAFDTRPVVEEQVKSLVQHAKKHGVTTIAERVEDANTMAVLWQLGVEFVQGYFVNPPEEVVI